MRSTSRSGLRPSWPPPSRAPPSRPLSRSRPDCRRRPSGRPGRGRSRWRGCQSAPAAWAGRAALGLPALLASGPDPPRPHRSAQRRDDRRRSGGLGLRLAQGRGRGRDRAAGRRTEPRGPARGRIPHRSGPQPGGEVLSRRLAGPRTTVAGDGEGWVTAAARVLRSGPQAWTVLPIGGGTTRSQDNPLEWPGRQNYGENVGSNLLATRSAAGVPAPEIATRFLTSRGLVREEAGTELDSSAAWAATAFQPGFARSSQGDPARADPRIHPVRDPVVGGLDARSGVDGADSLVGLGPRHARRDSGGRPPPLGAAPSHYPGGDVAGAGWIRLRGSPLRPRRSTGHTFLRPWRSAPATAERSDRASASPTACSAVSTTTIPRSLPALFRRVQLWMAITGRPSLRA
jgi:hypothetical protein